jgi:ADP-heptose:LPS heptosyltransferase
MRIAIFKIGAIGDSLLSTPLIRQLRRKYPNAVIDYIIGQTAAYTLTENKNLDEIIRFDETLFFRKDFLSWIRLIYLIRKRNYDTIFVLDKHKGCILTAYLTGIKNRVGFDRLGKEGKLLTHKAYYGNDKHEIYYYLDLLKVAGLRPDYSDVYMDLNIDNSSLSYAKSFWKKNMLVKKKVITLCPGGGNNPGESTGIRNWPVENYAALANALISKGYVVLLIGGKSDIFIGKRLLSMVDKNMGTAGIIDQRGITGRRSGIGSSIESGTGLSRRMKGQIYSLIGCLSLHKSAAVMAKCKYIVCNDSGPMHIAAAVNRKVISIFGPTNPARKAPLWNESKAIWKGNREYFPDYELYGKMPPKSSIDSIRKITVNDVLKLIK